MSKITDAPFTLHPQLAADTRPVTTLSLCDVLLVNDCRYIWCVLVPRLVNLRDFHDVPLKYKLTLHQEIDQVSAAVKEVSNAYKINVAALGNMVEQLHIHIVARHRSDTAWPAPVWGVGEAKPYQDAKATELITDICNQLRR